MGFSISYTHHHNALNYTIYIKKYKIWWLYGYSTTPISVTKFINCPIIQLLLKLLFLIFNILYFIYRVKVAPVTCPVPRRGPKEGINFLKDFKKKFDENFRK